jgi:hypothetical protein
LSARRFTVQPTTTSLRRTLRNCKDRVDWLGIAFGGGIVAIGGFLSAWVIGAIVGIPILLVGLTFFVKPMRTRVCA